MHAAPQYFLTLTSLAVVALCTACGPTPAPSAADTGDSAAAATATAQNTTELTGTLWELAAISGTVISVADEQRAPNLRLLSESDVVQGYSGCNQFSGTWGITAGRIELGPMAMTMMACADAMETETAFMQALAEMERHEILGDELRIYRGDEEVLRFTAVPQP